MKKYLLAAVAGLSLTFAFNTTALAQDMTPEEQAYIEALEESLPGTLMNNPLDTNWYVNGEDFKTKSARADVLPTGLAFQIKVNRVKPNPWDVSVSVPVWAGIEEGDIVLMAIYARASAPNKDSGIGEAQVRLQQSSAPYTGIAEQSLQLTEEWQLFYVSGQAQKSYKDGQLNVSLNVAQGKQTLEFGPVYVMNLGPDVELADMPSGGEPL